MLSTYFEVESPQEFNQKLLVALRYSYRQFIIQSVRRESVYGLFVCLFVCICPVFLNYSNYDCVNVGPVAQSI
jgi:hypothetical protein